MKKITQAVILAGGRGERLRPLTNDLPKPLAPVNGIPFLDYLIQSMQEVGIKRILLLLGYQSEKVVEHYRSWGARQELRIEFSIGRIDDLTGRRVLNAYDLLQEEFLLAYGDNYWPIEFEKMIQLFRQQNVGAMTTVFSNKNGTGEYGAQNNVEVTSNSLVKRYDKTRKSDHLTGVDIGYFLVKKSALDFASQDNISFEEYFLPRFVEQKQLAAYVTDRQYYYITDIPSLRRFEEFVIQNEIKFLAIEHLVKETG